MRIRIRWALGLCLAAAVVLTGIAWAQNVANYKEQGGARTVIGGSLDVISGGDLDIESGGALKLAGTTVTSTAAELNILDTVTAVAADLNQTASQVRSYYWPAIDLSADGTQCADAAQESTIAGPEMYTIVCTDNDAGMIGACIVMPDSWDAGTVTFEYTTIQTGAETLIVHGDMEVQCRGDGETVADTWSAEVAMDDAAQVGSSGIDTIQTASAITPAGTCAAGDLLCWQYSVDATGTTATVATNNFIGFKMEYTSLVGD
jgi:hypothetical protein